MTQTPFWYTKVLDRPFSIVFLRCESMSSCCFRHTLVRALPVCSLGGFAAALPFSLCWRSKTHSQRYTPKITKPCLFPVWERSGTLNDLTITMSTHPITFLKLQKLIGQLEWRSIGLHPLVCEKLAPPFEAHCCDPAQTHGTLNESNVSVRYKIQEWVCAREYTLAEISKL